MKYVILIFILFLVSCKNKTAQNNRLNKSIKLLSINKMNVDSLQSISYQDFVKTEKDSITLETKKTLFINLTFSDSISNVNIQLNTNEIYSTVSITADSIGCVSSNPKLLFVVNNKSKYDFSIYTGDEEEKCTFLFLSSSEPYDMYGVKKEMIMKEHLYGEQIEKIRLIKNDSTYVDMILNNADRVLLDKYYSAKLVEFNNN